MTTSGASFNIGSVEAGAVYMAARDQTVHHGGGTLVTAPTGAVADLRSALEAVALTEPARVLAEDALDAVTEELGEQAPDKGRIGCCFEQLLAVLHHAGALVTAGESLLPPLRALGSWLGPAAMAALGALA